MKLVQPVRVQVVALTQAQTQQMLAQQVEREQVPGAQFALPVPPELQVLPEQVLRAQFALQVLELLVRPELVLPDSA